ncbi:MAG: hypothetical protein AABN34_00410 [Acidobacteriota bacterium]
MINILSIRCSLAFAPYLAASVAEFLKEGAVTSRVVRQGGSGLIVRSDDNVVLRHQNRQAYFGREEAAHYLATVQFRSEFYDVARMQDEVVLANVGDELLLSHPQSELWLDSPAVSVFVDVFSSESRPEAEVSRSGLREWLTVSTGGGRLLISDQRTGRWVLLGRDHLGELERRLEALRVAPAALSWPAPPTISLKGLTVHLQSAFKLAATLEHLANTGSFEPFEEITPIYSLTALRSVEGIELRDSDKRVALTPREARKWADIISGELDRLNARQIARGGIRTVFAGAEAGRWILQWGDEVFVPSVLLSHLPSSRGSVGIGAAGPIVKRLDEFLLLLDPETGACVALTESESRYLDDSDEFVGGSGHSGAS